MPLPDSSCATETLPTPDGPIRCGVVGVGRMGRHHARVYGSMPETELVGVVDADHERAQGIVDAHGGRVFESIEQLLDAGVQAVSVAVPTTAHVAVTEPFLNAGVACLVEKPLAGSVEEARHLKEMSDRTGVTLMVGHIERFNPIMRALKRQHQQSGELIIPRFIEVHRVSPMTFRSVDIGVVMDMMIHDLDVVIMLMGGREPVDIQAAGSPVITPHEDFCNARLTFDGEHGRCVANITASRLALKTERVTRITGDNAYIKIDYAAKTGTMIRRKANELQMREVFEQLRAGKDLTDLRWDELVNIEPLTIDGAEPIEMEIRSFLHAMLAGRRPEIDATAGFANVRTAQRIVEACRADWGVNWQTHPAADPAATDEANGLVVETPSRRAGSAANAPSR